MEQGLITFFNVKSCGFYRLKDKKSVHVEGTMSEIIDLLYNWLKGRDFDQTIPWDIKAHVNRTRIYCKSAYIHEQTKDAVFVFWKQFGEDNGNLNGILAKSKVDDKGVDTHKVKARIKGQNVILGEPMYYWYIPEYNLMASIKFPHSLTDTESVCSYIKKCIDLRINNPRKIQSESRFFNHLAGREIVTKNVTYKSEDGSYSLSFKIDAEMKELSINDASLANLARRITHLVVRESISSSREIEKDSLFTMFDKLTRNKHGSMSRSKQVEIVSEEHFDADGLASILATYNSDHEPDSKWDNVGFKIDGIDKPTKWFDRYVDRKKIFVREDDKKEGSYFSAETLMDYILFKRHDLLDFMRRSTEEKIQHDLLEVDEIQEKVASGA